MKFKPGDPVRLLNSTDQGKIVKIIDDKLAEIEIEAGFSIPVLIRELVPIAGEESTAFGTESVPEPETQFVPEPVEPAIDDLMLALEDAESGEIRISLINNSDFTLLYAVFGTKSGSAYGLYKGVISPRTVKLLDTGAKNKLSGYQKLIFQLIFFSGKAKKVPMPLVNEMKWDPGRVLKKKRTAPLLEREAGLLNFGPGHKAVDPDQLKEQMMGGRPAFDYPDVETSGGPEEIVVDLHIEKLIDNPGDLSPGEILDLQTRTFEKALDDAVLSGAKRIKFIHGLGNGTLRYTIHKKLSKSPLIRYFEDVEKSKFGYGATMIHFK